MPHEALPRSLHAVRALSSRKRLVVLALAAVALIGLGYWIFGGSGKPKPAPPQAVAPGEFRPTDEQWNGFTLQPVEIVTFRTEQVTDGKIATNEDRNTPVFSPYSGRVTRVIAQPGQHLERGDPLLAIDANENVQALNNLIAATALVDKSRSQVNLTKTSERRLRDLYEAKAGALKDWQQAQADLVAAQNDLNSAESALAAARNQLRILGRNEKDIAEAETARRINAETIIGSPIGGTVIQRKVGLGQYLSTGASDPVYTIGDLSTVWLIANVKETDAPKMRIGLPVEVRVLAYPGRVFSAKVTYIASGVDPVTRRVTVRAEVENPESALKPEMFASFVLVTGDEVTSPAVPREAVIYEADTARVWVARDDRTIELRRIRAGMTSGDGLVQVVSGVQPGERVVTKGSLFIDRAGNAQ